MQNKDLIEKFYNISVQEGLWRNRSNLRFHLKTVFEGVSLKNKRMLDIGGGNGICSFYAACMGAKEAICLEPEADGVIAGSVNSLKRLQASGLSNRVRLKRMTFQRFAAYTEKKFDVILLYNSINHLDEWACINLLKNNKARRIFKDLFASFYRLANPGAYLILCDCTCRSFYRDLKVRNPMAPEIEWEKHQSPMVWVSLAAEAGYSQPCIRWSSFNSLGMPGRCLLGNRFAAYFLLSHFQIRMRRCD